MEQSAETIRRFEQDTRRFICRTGLLRDEDTVIVALSGGADSVALAAVLSSLGYRCIAAHCNYGLRGDESQRDMQHAHDVAGMLGMAFVVRCFDVSAEMSASPGESVEMACRRLRYEWFRTLVVDYGAQAVAIGHHREDRVETFMLNLMRGAGIVGLTSMNACNGNIVRPLLWASRTQIEDYVAAKGLRFVDDSSNFGNDYRRNRMRNIVIPQLESLFPGAADAILRSIGNLESTRGILMQAVALAKEKYVYADGRIDLRGLSGEVEAVSLLLEILRGSDFTPQQISDMLCSASGSGQVFFSGSGMVAEIDRGILSIRSNRNEARMQDYETTVSLQNDIVAPLHIRVTVHPAVDFGEPERNASVAYLDADYSLQDDAVWTVRHWRNGDRMTPFGSRTPKLVSDIFADAHYTAAQKRQAWMLMRNGVIVWIPGLRNSAHGTVGPETQRYLRLEYQPEQTS